MSNKDVSRSFIHAISEIIGREVTVDFVNDHVSLSTSTDSPPPVREILDKVGVMLTRERADRLEIATLQNQLQEAKRLNIDLSEQNEALGNMVIHDLLTGLYTKWFVHEKIEEEIERSTRFAQPTSVLMVDLDHFKNVNDSYGHLVGDEVLRELGQVIKDSLRTYDVPGRYGGEEFCLMLPSTNTERTILVAERIRANIEAHKFELPGISFGVTASIGIAGLEERSSVHTADGLIDLADQALYAAKESGRNRIELWQEPN